MNCERCKNGTTLQAGEICHQCQRQEEGPIMSKPKINSKRFDKWKAKILPVPSAERMKVKGLHSASECSALAVCRNPLSFSKTPQPIESVLRILASQEGCDGQPYDQMLQAADYIDHLKQNDESRKSEKGTKNPCAGL